MGYDPYAGYSSSYNPYAGTGTKAPAHGGHGVGGFFSNLGSDVKGAVEGFIPGTVHLIEHPIAGAETMAKGMWSTWSPLLHGKFTKFGQGVYEHPLAPLLDLAAVASGGLGAAAKIGELSTSDALLAADRSALQAGESLDPASNIFHAAARLKMPKTVTLEDRAATEGGKGRGFVQQHYSQRPLRRLMQDHVNPRILGSLPQHSQDALMQLKFNRLLYGEMARRATAANVSKLAFMDSAAKADVIGAARAGHLPILDAAMLAGKSLIDPTSATRVRQELAAGMHMNLARNAPLRLTPEEIPTFLKAHPHFRMVKAMSAMDASHGPLLTQLRGKEARLEARALKAAPLAHALPKIDEQLQHHNAQLQEMYDKGYLHTHTPAVDSKGVPTPAGKTPTVRQSMEQHAQPILETQRNVKMLTRLQNKAHIAKAAHDDAVSKLADIKAQRMNLEHRSFAEYYSHVASSETAFNNFAENFGRHAVTRDMRKAWVGMDGKVPIVPHHDATMLGQELHGSSDFLTRLVRHTTAVWKGIQVKFTPKTVLNNTLGNHVIYAMRSADPMTATRSMIHALRVIHTPDDANNILMRATPWRNKSWLFQHFTPELHNTFKVGTVGEDRVGTKLAQSTSRARRVLQGPGMYSLVQKIADEPTRLASIIAYVHGDPEVIARADELMAKARSRGASMSRTEALDRAASRVIKRNPDLRARAADYGRSVAGDYLNLTAKERQIQNWVPFYLWDRHILKSGSNLLKDTPGRAVMLQQLSQMGEGETKKYLGNVPSFLAGALPLQMLGIKGLQSPGRISTLVAPSLNPWGTLGDIAGLAQATTVGGDKQTGGDLFSQLNPLATAAIEYGTGKSLLTGAPVKRTGGLLTSVLAQLGQGFPETKVVAGAVNPPVTQTKSGKPKLYSQNELSAISNFLGVPIKQISPPAAAAQYKKEAGITSATSRKKKQYNPYG